MKPTRPINRRRWLATAMAGGAAWYVSPLLRAAARPDDEEMIHIPGGPFLMGTTREQAEELARQYGCHVSWLGGEWPQRTIELPPFAIDRFPVTNRRYAFFCEATGHAPPPHWGGPRSPERLLDHPVTHVNRADGRTFARWSGKHLPTEAQWEKAARGNDGRLYPWGDSFDADACHHDRGGVKAPLGTAPVTAHPKGASPLGVMDLIGNAAEWCDDDPGPASAFIKGGCWHTSSPLNLRCAARGLSGFDNNKIAYIGFRCVKEV